MNEQNNKQPPTHSLQELGAKGIYYISLHRKPNRLLNRIAIIFTRRKINIDSLNTSPTEVDSVHRFTIVINETEDVVRKLCRQIEKQVEVLKAYYNTTTRSYGRNLHCTKCHRCDCRRGAG
jgi:acetolactate synthase small subunit